MPTTIIHPESPLRPEALDTFLQAGYRPAGQAIYSCDYLREEEQDAVYGCIQLRFPLADFTFKKRHRRLLRRNAAHFRIEIGAAQDPDAEMDVVNRRYMEVHPDKSRADLSYHLRAEWDGERKLNTHCVRVYHGTRLVAFSFLDVGRTSVYTKAGIYDPAYAKYSLGTYTLLLEMQWALEQGFAYYHPGYYAPEFPAFHYKLDFAPAEYRDFRSGEWLPLPDNDPTVPVDPYRYNESVLRDAQAVLAAAGINSTLKEYPSFTARFHFPGAARELLDAPFVLQPGRLLANGLPSLIAFEHTTGEYRCFLPQGSGLRDLRMLLIGPTGYPRYPKPVFAEHIIARAKSPKRLVAALRGLEIGE